MTLYSRSLLQLIAFGISLCAAPAGSQQFGQPPQQTPTGPWIVPDEEKTRENPIRPTKESIERGKLLFMENCSGCHGREGLGDGPTREFVPMNPANLADPKFAAEHTDGEWFWKISTGRYPMLPYKDFIGEEDRWSIVNFLRTLSMSQSPATGSFDPSRVAGVPARADGPGGFIGSPAPTKTKSPLHYALLVLKTLVISVVGMALAGWALGARGRKTGN